MATPPTFQAEYETASWDTTTSPKTASVTTVAGDVLAIFGMTEDSATTLGTPTGNSLTYALQQSITVSLYCANYMWTATDGAGGTGWTLSCNSIDTTRKWGFNCLRFSGSDGVGASAKTNVASGAPSLAITTTADNSALVVSVGDWNVVDGASRTWRTVNGITPTAANGGERTYFTDSLVYTVYGAYYSDAGAAGVKTVGLSAPAGQKYSIIAVEIKGSAGAVVAPPNPVIMSQAVHRSYSY